MPGFYHDELRRVWASLDANKGTRGPVELSVGGQALQGKGTYSNRLLSHTPASGQSGGVLSADVRRADRGGKGPEAERWLDHGAGKRHLPGLPHGEDPRPRHELPENGVDQDCEARHDRHVSVPPRLREVQRRMEIRPTRRPEPEA